MEIKLQKPIERDGQNIKTLNLDLEKLTGHDLIKAEQEARAMGDNSLNPLFGSQGLAAVAARAGGIIMDDIMALPGPDFLQVINTVSSFLYGWVVGDDTNVEGGDKC
jgi:hypothetical protein